MIYKHTVKANGKWYAAGEEVPEATAITDVEPVVEPVVEPEAEPEVEPEVEAEAEPEAPAEEQKATGKRKTAKK